jgi:hypothetical protein
MAQPESSMVIGEPDLKMVSCSEAIRKAASRWMTVASAMVGTPCGKALIVTRAAYNIPYRVSFCFLPSWLSQ